MADLLIKYPCTVCDGTGVITAGDPPTESQCTNCNGDGNTQEAYIIDSGDLVDKIDDIGDKLDDIIEKLNE